MIKLAATGLGLASLIGAATAPGLANPPGVVHAPSFTAAAAFDDWAELTGAYDRAVGDWQAEYDEAADLDTRRALRDQHPAHAFWSRYEALADAGEGRAMVWMLDNAGVAGHKGAKGRRVKAGVYERLFPNHVSAVWFEDVLVNLAGDRRAVGDELFERYLESAAETAELPSVKARALLVLGSWLVKSKDDETVRRGWPLLERAVQEYGDTEAGTEASELIYVQRNLVVGALAPDFEGQTIDGTSFTLADHRGKVVVLDFFGFW